MTSTTINPTAAGHTAYISSETSAYGVEYHTARCAVRDCGWKSDATSSTFMANRWISDHQAQTTPDAPRFSYYHEGDTVYVYDWHRDQVVHEYLFGHEAYIFAGALCRQLEIATDSEHRERVMQAWQRVGFDARRAPLVA